MGGWIARSTRRFSPVQLRCSALFSLFLLAISAALFVSAAGATAGEGRYIVVFNDSVEHPGRVAHAQLDESDGDMTAFFRRALDGYAATLPTDQVDDIRRDPQVDYITVDHKVGVLEEVELETKNNGGVEIFEATLPTGIERTFASTNKALDIDKVDDLRTNVDVAVIDTGIDYEHPDLNVVGRTICTSGTCIDNSGKDGHSHGTHVAGTIGAIDNGIGVVGIAPGARMWGVKVLSDAGSGQESWIIKGVEWVTAHASEIEVANMSLGCNCSMPALDTAINKSVEAGVVYAVAAGNSSSDAKFSSPASNPNVITVSAVADYDGKPGAKASATCANYGLDDHSASFSNYGAGIDIAAPGVCTLSTTPGNTYGTKSGTSMAAPHVAGAAAILASLKNPGSKADVETIRNTIVAAGNFEWTDTSGDGVKEPLLDLHNESTFKLQSPPTATTGTATGVAETSATLNGTVNPNGLSTTYRFEYGTSLTYGTSVPIPDGSVGSGTSNVAEAQAIAGLTPGTIYHFRIVATNAAGTANGVDQTFKTAGWSIQESPNPGGEKESAFYGVSCVLSTSCKGVGTYKTPASVTGSLLQSWNGSNWIDQSISGGPELRDVSCTSSTACTAVGRAAAYRWNGLEWKSQSIVIPAGSAETVLEGVSCVSATACTAVGWYREGSTFFTLVETWNGIFWSKQTSPNPAGGSSPELSDVSCTSSSACIAVGTYRSSGKSVPLAEIWNGTEWKVQTTPKPSGATESRLADVSCTSSTACTAVGRYLLSGSTNGLVERWNGVEWKEQSAKRIEGASTEFFGVSCTSSTACTAVGRYRIPGGGLSQGPGVEAWDGTEWSVQEARSPTGPPGSGLQASLVSVSCTSSSSCTSVGWYYFTVEGVMQTKYTLVEERH